VENSLVRFGLPAILWGILLYIAWNRQHSQDLPREKLPAMIMVAGAFLSVNQLGIFILQMAQIVFRRPISISFALHQGSQSAFTRARI
jgi:hypothetical protein